MSPADVVVETVPFTAGDGMKLNLKRIRGSVAPWKGPVLLAPGAGVRAELFRPPEAVTVVDALLADGWEVWLENWRASIDVPRNRWNLDQAAAYDHPQAVRTICDLTGAERVKAVVHCQGSSSFMLAVAAGLLPEVDNIVANSMSLHPVVPAFSAFKLRRLVPLIAPLLPYVDTRWGEPGHPPPNPAARALVAMVHATHRECANSSCRMISFTYGSGRPALWSHENLSERTHDWLRAEFGAVPLSFFGQMARSVHAGQLLPTGQFSCLPTDLLNHRPKSEARIALLTGSQNRCFLPESQYRTLEYLEKHRPGGPQSIKEFDGYGHLDVFFARYAARDIFDYIIEQLNR
ncbi:hypothetical protein MINS_30640 [Mycolicibacterium insubricum]|uniref:Esterase n=1 Tax=Mycolicibacterium insubricum TaxID=444597 RepID=A0A1X0DIY0_9MYCO|nr:esterase [Mycolicibacterium insubricum]MCB9441384.1 esterase [Mycolicibacterium sp.]ORA72341.1 esterase [Mycolicibacterium insubricum]BBZ67635.1 hypothetical protein MINS_30640 [Mycolicibacterium insubricum]